MYGSKNIIKITGSLINKLNMNDRRHKKCTRMIFKEVNLSRNYPEFCICTNG